MQDISSLLKKLRPLDALLPISIVVQLDKAQNSLSLGLLLIWVALRFLDPVVKNRSRNDNRHSGTVYALFLGLLLFQARAIVTRSDETGISQYLMVALGLAVGFSLGLDAWRRLLQWINLATLAISITLLSHFRLEHGWLQDLNRQLFNEGYGNINRLGVVMCLLTISSWASARLSRHRLFQALGACGTVVGYLTCLATESRMAAITPLFAVLASWLILHARPLLKSKTKAKLPLMIAAGLIPLGTIWTFVILPDLDVGFSGDITRMRLIRCWAGSLFSGQSSLLYGTGHDRSKIMELCSDANIGNIWAGVQGASGHAHNTYAQLIALHGLFGIVAILILVLLISRGMIHQCRMATTGDNPDTTPEWASFSWGEACLGFNLTVLIGSLATTIHIYNHVNQLLIGLLLSASLAPSLTTRNTRPSLPPESL